MKQLIVNADDFGRAPGVNRGILDAHHNGIVTSTTVMINYPYAPAALDEALDSAPDLGLGLHLNLTSGRPVSSPETVPSLVNADGVFYHISDLAPRYGDLDADDIRRELTAQVARFISQAGRPPDHLDAHHHSAYLHPAALAVLLDLAAEYQLPVRRPSLRFKPGQTFELLSRYVSGLPEETIRQFSEQMQTVFDERPAPLTTDALELDFYDERATLGDLLVILTNLPHGITELMCHPGYVDDALATSVYAAQREEEVKHLTHAATKECIQAEGIRLITFGDIPR
ncbi:MAG: ChbG/HpnK family deacetylase [Anaerolineae bacterium]|nr:ChbG/HpnK family deacetylase [Anaerolineae bacterium]